MQPLIATGSLTRSSLAGRVAIVTGAGRGIGFETARALAWLGARVVIAEIDEESGAEAAKQICAEMGGGSATFVRTDVGDGTSLGRAGLGGRPSSSAQSTSSSTTPRSPRSAPVGIDAAEERGTSATGSTCAAPSPSRGSRFPRMVERKRGVFVRLSSVGGAYMAPYEAIKAAQAELAAALAAELEAPASSPSRSAPVRS